MKSIWSKLILLFFIFLGILFLLFVLRMTWFPPSSMGMMMGKSMMMHHTFYMFQQIFWFSIIFAGMIGLVWAIKNKGK